MKIFVTGTRGIPNIPGGVEKHCQELFPRIAANGHEVLLCTRSSYVTEKIDKWQDVKLINCFAPRKKSLEVIIHTFIALFKARRYCPDVVHIHAVGPSLLTPLARLLGYRVVVTNHGPDYDRQKWGRIAKFVLRVGEKMGGVYANEVIAISSLIERTICVRCHRESNLVYNGVTLPEPSEKFDFLTKIGAVPRKYILAVARFVPEKGLHDLIEAFKRIKGSYKLVIAGDADHETDYSKHLRQMACEDNRIILTGYITGEHLNQVYTHAGLFVLPSYHEGLPIALLEAMSYGLSVLVSDIPANKEVHLPAGRYFRCGDVVDLKEKMETFLHKEVSEEERNEMRTQIEEKYNWDKIAEQTIKVYKKTINR
ncbi:MAG: glycosyl transferase family 1 [Desulfobacterales bacterium PC51MH44]|nr:MAG: glycosyl transferase family 1 [Desulfobacterales bacterium PC51MH44]